MTTRDLDAEHARPDGATDAEVAAAGKVSEALEYVERARGRLYDLHQLIGHADLLLGEAATMLQDAGHPHAAERLRTDIVGLNVLTGRWTFQIVEEFDDGYWSAVRAADQRIRDEILGGRRHVFEAEMKQERRTHGRAGHEATPGDV